MNKEEYVSFEVAKMLKEKGFSEEVTAIYQHLYQGEDGWKLRCGYIADKYNDDGNPYAIAAPTLWQAAKWLRDEKGIAINVIAHQDSQRLGKYHWKEVYLPNCKEEGGQWSEWCIYGNCPLFDSYEAALLNGIEKMVQLLNPPSPQASRRQLN